MLRLINHPVQISLSSACSRMLLALATPFTAFLKCAPLKSSYAYAEQPTSLPQLRPSKQNITSRSWVCFHISCYNQQQRYHHHNGSEQQDPSTIHCPPHLQHGHLLLVVACLAIPLQLGTEMDYILRYQWYSNNCYAALEHQRCVIHELPHPPAGHPRVVQPTTTASPPGLDGATHVVVVEPDSSPPCGKINPHDQKLLLRTEHCKYSARNQRNLITESNYLVYCSAP